MEIPASELNNTDKIQSPNPIDSATNKHIFILSGQSNMAGRGGVSNHHPRQWDGVVPPECHPNPCILRLTAKLHWETAHEPLHSDIDSRKTCGVGPGMSFANAVRERVGLVGLVPCAVGGTAIKEWARGEHLYENMVKRARESVKDGGEIKALLWYQGESDTSTQHDAEAYKANMERLIHNVREDLGLPSLPIIQVAIASGDGKFMGRVREAQLDMQVHNVVCVDAKGLQLKDDHLHLTTHAQVQLGHMLARRAGSSPCHLPLAVRLQIARGVARGLAYIHEKKHVHGNIKPSNILLNPDMEPIISDFGRDRLLFGNTRAGGSARHLGSYSSTSRDGQQDFLLGGSPSGGSCTGGASPYQAPESLKNLKHNAKWDVFSFGIVLLELLTGRVFSERELSQWSGGGSMAGEERNRMLRMFDVAIRTEVENKEDAMLGCLKLGLSCACFVPQKRPTMKEALQVLDKIPSFSISH